MLLIDDFLSNSDLVILLLHHYFSLDVFQWVSGNIHVKNSYSSPPQVNLWTLFLRFHFPMCSHDVYVRGNWEISRRDLNSTHLVSMVPTDQNVTTSNYDQYSASAAGSLICCRSIAVIVTSLVSLVHEYHCALTPTCCYISNLCFSWAVHGSSDFKTHTSPCN